MKRPNASSLVVVLGGQLCSLLTALTGPCASAIADRGVFAPTAMNAPAYALLASLILLRRNQFRKDDYVSAWLLLGLIDVEANCLVVWAYQYTSLTSIMLIDCFTIPCVMVLSKLFLKAEYGARHALGALVCGIGLGLTVLSDAMPSASPKDSSPRNKVYGDLLALGGATLYAVSNVAQEATVKRADPLTLLSRLGMAGAIVSIVQAIAFNEIGSLKRGVAHSNVVVLAFVGYVVSLASLYIASSHFLQVADAAALNLSLLTSDAWAILYSWAVVAHHHPPALYFLALATTVSGVIIYHSVPQPTSAPEPRRRTLSFGTSEPPQQSSTTSSPLLLTADEGAAAGLPEGVVR